MVSIQGYGDAQIANAATIADVARSMGLGDRGALLGVMCAMGESSLWNIDYGDWETNGVRNPNGTPTSSIGLFQQQAWWGSPAERMDPRYAAWAFFNALAKVRDWATLPPTIAIHRVQVNADPNHYAKYETPARAVLAHITEARARGVRFMGAPAIEWIRDGVGFRPDAAASFRRAEASWGPIPCNSTYRDYGTQLSMWQAWTAWTEGRGPKPNHSRALHPDESMHCQGLALDTNLWTVRGFIDHMADHGWIRTAAWDPTEQHHFEYQWWRDNHRNDPAPAGTAEEDDMFDDEDRAILQELRNNRQAAPINFRSTTGGVSYTMIPGIQIVRHENIIAAALTLQFVTGEKWDIGTAPEQKAREALGERQLRDDEILSLLAKFGFAWTAKNIARLPEAGKVRYADWIMELRGEDLSK